MPEDQNDDNETMMNPPPPSPPQPLPQQTNPVQLATKYVTDSVPEELRESYEKYKEQNE
jgi:hypothetical protein